MTTTDSLRAWLAEEVGELLKGPNGTGRLVLWCDPRREWLELLRMLATTAAFELWGDEQAHELALRDRFFCSPRVARIIWVPRGKDELTWLKVVELEAGSVRERSLLDALRDYGVRIPREHERDLLPILPAHAKEWFDLPRDTWNELTPGVAKGTLLDDQRMLDVLGGQAGEFDRLRQEDRFGIFVRRAVDDFGLPDPSAAAEPDWRVAATARLLATEAAAHNPQNPPNEGDRIVPSGLARDNALRLLKMWQSNVHLMASFEALSDKADATLGLGYWARSASPIPRSMSSRVVEMAVFEQIVQRLDRIDDVMALAKELEHQVQALHQRRAGFWEALAVRKIGWTHFVQLAESGALLVEHAEADRNWHTADDAARWYAERGWHLDHGGERLFVEPHDFPPSLSRIRGKLRLGYLRTVDRIGQAFSGLLDSAPGTLWKTPSAGECLVQHMADTKTPTALVYLDAFRFELGKRLAEMLNKGEPAERAVVDAALAPIPSMTCVGMAMALPVAKDDVRVSIRRDENSIQVAAQGFSGDLAIAANRRAFITAKLGAKDFLTIKEVFEGDKLKPPTKARRILVVEGGDIDASGHEGELSWQGTEEALARCVQAVRRLHAAGYLRVIVLTDHGFFHWQPAADEILEAKPDGDLLWQSRRAMLGYGLKHKSGLKLPVTCSDLEAVVPRSTGAFKTYGGMGYFHGGATLQELVIPVVRVAWPPKTVRTPVVLKPVQYIASEKPRVQIEAGVTEAQGTFFADAGQVTRRVEIRVRETSGGYVVFRHGEPVTIDPQSGPKTVQLDLAEPRRAVAHGTPLIVEVRDAESEEILAREDITLKVDIDEW